MSILESVLKMHQNEYKQAYVWSSGSWDSMWYFQQDIFFPVNYVVIAWKILTFFKQLSNADDKLIFSFPENFQKYLKSLWKISKKFQPKIVRKFRKFSETFQTILWIMHQKQTYVWNSDSLNNKWYFYSLYVTFSYKLGNKSQVLILPVGPTVSRINTGKKR